MKYALDVQGIIEGRLEVEVRSETEAMKVATKLMKKIKKNSQGLLQDIRVNVHNLDEINDLLHQLNQHK